MDGEPDEDSHHVPEELIKILLRFVHLHDLAGDDERDPDRRIPTQTGHTHIRIKKWFIYQRRLRNESPVCPLVLHPFSLISANILLQYVYPPPPPPPPDGHFAAHDNFNLCLPPLPPPLPLPHPPPPPPSPTPHPPPKYWLRSCCSSYNALYDNNDDDDDDTE